MRQWGSQYPHVPAGVFREGEVEEGQLDGFDFHG